MRTRELRLGWFFRRGDIYLANLNPFTGSEQGGTRPVLVLQNNDGNFYCPTLIVAPMTTQIKKLNQPTHYICMIYGRNVTLIYMPGPVWSIHRMASWSPNT